MSLRRGGRRRAGAVPVLVIAVALLGQARCIWGTDEQYLATDELTPLQVRGNDPVAGETSVPRTARLTLRFTDRVRPQSVVPGAVRLLEGGAEVAAATRVDLIRCEITVEAASPLAVNTAYTLEADGLVGFGSGAMERAVSVPFVTGVAAPPVDPPLWPSFAEVYAVVIAPRCATCHGSYLPPGGLDLSRPDVAEQGLLEGRSRYADGAPAYVVPGHHAASYLMHKVLALPGIWGDPMPLVGDWPMDRTCGSPDPELRLLADWIDGL